jgi:NAD(P)-dependent dehydrogenase (short-subunit alcohol dehydrogenase family)
MFFYSYFQKFYVWRLKMSFKDKVAIITGAAGGTGFEISDRFASEGIHVVMADLSDNVTKKFDEIKSKYPGCNGFGYQIDLTDEMAVKAMVEKTVEKLGKLDIMFNNAGINMPMTLLTEETEERIDKFFSCNFKSSYFGSKYAAIQMLKQGSGSIVNTASFYGLQGRAYFSTYCASKAAVIAYSQALALELAGTGVRCNIINPGVMGTEMHWRSLREEAEITGETFEEVKERTRLSVPLKRHGRGYDLAGAALWLSSDDASYITGEMINVTGGMDLTVK